MLKRELGSLIFILMGPEKGPVYSIVWKAGVKIAKTRSEPISASNVLND